MPRKSKNTFEVVGKDIYIRRDDWDFIAYTTFREDYYQELISATWTFKEGYLFNTKLGYLHRYVMKKWYGENAFQDFDARGYVIDHLVNEGTDCRISNLEFLKKSHNTAKGLTFDQESEKLIHRIAIRMFKDFITGCYQISIGCNDSIYGTNLDGTRFFINSIKLLYNCDYSLVVQDAEAILLRYEQEGKISLSKTFACDIRVEKAVDIQLTEEEKSASIVMRDGVPYLVMGTGHTYIISSHYDEGWIPPGT